MLDFENTNKNKKSKKQKPNNNDEENEIIVEVIKKETYALRDFNMNSKIKLPDNINSNALLKHFVDTQFIISSPIDDILQITYKKGRKVLVKYEKGNVE